MVQTLTEIGKLLNNDIISPVIDAVARVNPIFQFMPAYGYTGKAAVISTRPDQTASFLAEGAAVPAATSTTFTQRSVLATTLIRDADVSNLSIASGAGEVNAAGIEIDAAAMGVGNLLQNGMINGTGTAPEMGSLFSETTVTLDAAGTSLSFALLDKLLDLVKSAKGRVDFIVMSFSQRQSYRALLRALGGNTLDNITLADGQSLDQYEGVPIFVSSWKIGTESLDGTALTGGTNDSIYAGVFDSGNLTDGVSIVYPAATPAGMAVEPLGNLEGFDAKRFRVKFYGNFVVSDKNSCARLFGLI